MLTVAQIPWTRKGFIYTRLRVGVWSVAFPLYLSFSFSLSLSVCLHVSLPLFFSAWAECCLGCPTNVA
jgi:hypothetical protein